MRVEFILRDSVIADVIDNWCAMGNADNSNDGGFSFADVEKAPTIDGGQIMVEVNKCIYIYSVSDFYRIKISD